MDHGQLEIRPGIWLDARRALYLEPISTLAVADLHLGYAWASRRAGALLPLANHDHTTGRLLALVDSYRPARVVLLGDITHRALPLPAIESELRGLVDAIASRAELHLIAGNHDRNLTALLGKVRPGLSLVDRLDAPPFSLFHGDTAIGWDGLGIMGHEHPALSLPDRSGPSAKCPCFLVSDRLIVLPAFSKWAAGTCTRRFLSPSANAAQFHTAVVILGARLLPFPW